MPEPMPMSDARLAEIRDVYVDDHECIGELLAEVERLRGERVPQHPAVAELMRLTPQELSVRRCAWCSSNPSMAGLWCLCIAACGSTDCKHEEAGEVRA